MCRSGVGGKYRYLYVYTIMLAMNYIGIGHFKVKFTKIGFQQDDVAQLEFIFVGGHIEYNLLLSYLTMY